MFCYSSRQAYNSCMSMFPNIAAKQHLCPVTEIQVVQAEEAKKSRVAQMKQIRAAKYEKKENSVCGLPVLHTESRSDIIHDKDQYMADLPTYKAASNTKINFQAQRQPEFEVNPDIDVLHQMFPSIHLNVIYSKYQACSESLHNTIDTLLAAPVTTIPDIQNEELWPSLCEQKTEDRKSSQVHCDTEFISNSVIHSDSILTEQCSSQGEGMSVGSSDTTVSESYDDFDLVVIDAQTYNDDNSENDYDDGSVDEWVVIAAQDSPLEGCVDEAHQNVCNNHSISDFSPAPFSYKDILLAT